MPQFSTTPPIPYVSIGTQAAAVRSQIDTYSKAESQNSFGRQVIYGNQQKLAAKVAVNPAYKARVLYIGDSLVEGKLYQLDDILRGSDNRRGAMVSGTWGPNGTLLDGQYSVYPTGLVKVLDATATSFIVADSGGTVARYSDSFQVGHIAENNAGTYKIEVSKLAVGPWIEIAASVNANNGSTATGVLTTYQMPYEGDLFVKISRVSGTVRFVCFGQSLSGIQGGMFSLFRGGLDITPHFIAASQAILAPIVASWDPDIIYWEAADSGPDMQTHLVNYINKIQANLSSKAGVIVATRNSWLGDTNDVEQISQASALFEIATANNYGFIDWRQLFGSGVLANAQGLVLPSSNVHPSEAGYALQIKRLRTVWPSVWDLDKQDTALGAVRIATQPLTPNTLVESLLLRDTRIPVALGCAVISTTTGGFADKNNGLVTIGLNANVTSGSAKAVLRDLLFSGNGTGTGTRFGTEDYGFKCVFSGRNFSSATHRIFWGPDGQTLSGRGFGVEFDTTGAYLLAHNGATLTRSFIPTSNDGNTNFGNNIYSFSDRHIVVTCDFQGNVSFYWATGTPNIRTKANIILHKISGGPTSVGLSGDRFLVATSNSTGVSNVSSPALNISHVEVFQSLF